MVTKVSNADRLSKLREKLKHVDLGGSSGFWSPDEGDTTIRIMPTVGDMEWFFQAVGKHNLPPKGAKSFYCPRIISEGELPCPICEIVEQLYKSGDANRELADQLRVRRSFWMNVIARGKENLGPQVYTPGVKVFQAVSSIISDPDYGDIMDVNDGLDIVITRVGTGLATEYPSVRPKAKRTPLSSDPDRIKEWLKKAKDLSYVEVSSDPDEDAELSAGHVIYILPYDRLAAEFGLDNVDNDEEDAPKKAVKKGAAPMKSAKLTKPAVEEDDEEDVEDEEDEPDVKKEVARRQAQRARPSSRR